MTSNLTAVERRRLTSLRLAAQGITGARRAGAAGIVRSMLAIQGQDLPGARWSIGLRGAGLTDREVGAAFDAAEIVRSWPMRGTLHVTAAEDMGWMLGLMAGRTVRATARRRGELGLTDADLARARDAAVAVLEGGRALGREELLDAFVAHDVAVDAQRGYHLLGYLAQTGVIVQGPIAGTRQAFVLLDEWVPAPRRLAGDEALGELAGRYYRSHGPATEPDLARWSGLPLGDVRRGLAVAGDRVTHLEVAGMRYHLAPEVLDAGAADGPSDPGAGPVVHLLPGFDEYILGYLDRTAALGPEHAQAVVPGNNGMFLATVVVDGQVVGTWKRTQRARHALIEPSPFAGPLGAEVVVGLAAAAQAYGSFLVTEGRLA